MGVDGCAREDGFRTQRKKGYVASRARQVEILSEAVVLDVRKEWSCRFCIETNVWTIAKCRRCGAGISSLFLEIQRQPVSSNRARYPTVLVGILDKWDGKRQDCIESTGMSNCRNYVKRSRSYGRVRLTPRMPRRTTLARKMWRARKEVWCWKGLQTRRSLKTRKGEITGSIKKLEKWHRDKWQKEFEDTEHKRDELLHENEKALKLSQKLQSLDDKQDRCKNNEELLETENERFRSTMAKAQEDMESNATNFREQVKICASRRMCQIYRKTQKQCVLRDK